MVYVFWAEEFGIWKSYNFQQVPPLFPLIYMPLPVSPIGMFLNSSSSGSFMNSTLKGDVLQAFIMEKSTGRMSVYV